MNQNPLNLNSKYSVAMERESKLFLIMSEVGEYGYSLYVIGDPQVVPGDDDDEETITSFGKPLLKMKNSKYPYLMSFAAIGPRIFMLGGCLDDGTGKYSESKKVFIYDTMSSTMVPGPDLNCALVSPFLLTLGSKLFALSSLLTRCDRVTRALDPEHAIQVLDTEDLESGWSNLPLPRLHVAKGKKAGYISALAAVFVGGSGCSGGVIFISVENAGTYAFDVDNLVWDYVSDEPMPFSYQAKTIPHDPSLCCADSLKSNKFCAFRFSYGGHDSNQVFQIVETEIDISYRLFPLIPPLISYRSREAVLGPNGEVYFVFTGVDKDVSYDRSNGNRYVKVSALEFSNPKLGLKGHMKKNQIGYGEEQDAATKVDLDKGRRLKRCKNEKMKMVHDEEQDEIVEVDLKQSLKRCSKKKNKRRKEDEGEVTKGLKLIGRWRMCYFGGMVADEFDHVLAAFAM